MQKVTVRNMRGRTGQSVPNQFIINTNDGEYFQSYQTIIAFKPYGGKIQLAPDYDYSVTTGKYRNQFLGESIAVTRHKIETGEYEVTELN
jgi:hypothetical protein